MQFCSPKNYPGHLMARHSFHQNAHTQEHTHTRTRSLPPFLSANTHTKETCKHAHTCTCAYTHPLAACHAQHTQAHLNFSRPAYKAVRGDHMAAPVPQEPAALARDRPRNVQRGERGGHAGARQVHLLRYVRKQAHTLGEVCALGRQQSAPGPTLNTAGHAASHRRQMHELMIHELQTNHSCVSTAEGPGQDTPQSCVRAGAHTHTHTHTQQELTVADHACSILQCFRCLLPSRCHPWACPILDKRGGASSMAAAL